MGFWKWVVRGCGEFLCERVQVGEVYVIDGD